MCVGLDESNICGCTSCYNRCSFSYSAIVGRKEEPSDVKSMGPGNVTTTAPSPMHVLDHPSIVPSLMPNNAPSTAPSVGPTNVSSSRPSVDYLSYLSSQTAALVSFFESTNGNHWHDSSNCSTSASVCSWFGVTCRGDSCRDGLVIALECKLERICWNFRREFFRNLFFRHIVC
mmetsp:Transcript_6242/g.9110  ORF Transcript_6242/g.9110 Transcript_6242/m.9110 type:complete len:174 (-) Transcript_6242:109-630(-)